MAVTAQRHEGVGGVLGSQTRDAIALLPLRGVPEPALTHVHRPRLHRTLGRTLDRPGRRHLVLVSAPAGTTPRAAVAAIAKGLNPIPRPTISNGSGAR